MKDFLKKNKRLYCECICECGRKITCLFQNVKREHTKGCGCLKYKHLKDLHKQNTLLYGEASFNRIYGNYKYRSRKKNIEFNLSKDEFKKLIDNKCFYCSALPANISVKPTFNGEYRYNGIDRVNSLVGYVLENCVSCCEICNIMKNDLSKIIFLNQIKIIYEKFYVKSQNINITSCV